MPYSPPPRDPRAFQDHFSVMDIGTWLFTLIKGELVGTDRYGNRYYTERRGKLNVRNNGRARRWVMYKGAPEGSKVPQLWNAWLHHTTDTAPVGTDGPMYAWQIDHQPNMTGTPQAYRPPGSLLKGGHRAKASGDYEAWKPE
jgi:NADH:ubiquinone oxidoreductase subunit